MNYSEIHIIPQILSSITRRLNEVTIAPEDALDELTELDPETALGRTMTDIMVKIANLGLMDFYLGYDRLGNTIKLYLSKEAKTDSLKRLVAEIENEIETPSEMQQEIEKTPITQVTMFRSAMDDEFMWVVRIQVFINDDGEGGYVDTPVEITMDGDVDIISNKKEKTPGNEVPKVDVEQENEND